MSTRTETVIIGAGQAGLALSRCLTELGRPHVVLERGRIAERWRTERWDSFRLLTPNWHTRLPGRRYAGDDPDGFMGREAVVAMFERYARSFDAPVRERTTVLHVAASRDGWLVATDHGEVAARNVVVATGPHGTPYVPGCATSLPPDLTQLHSRGYRNPDQLPPGPVLVVGAGPTGQQLASELVRAGREVHLAVGRHTRAPRTYRGRDIFWWLEETGASRDVLDPRRPNPRPPHVVLGAGRDLGLATLVEEGVRPLGRLIGVDGQWLTFDRGLAERYLDAEAAAARFRDAADAHAAEVGLDLPPADPVPPVTVPDWARSAPQELDLRRAGVTTVLWATGFRRDFRWLPRAVLDRKGEPVHRRGVTRADGLFFLGLTWLHRRGSATIDGVGADARHLAEVLDRRAARQAAGHSAA